MKLGFVVLLAVLASAAPEDPVAARLEKLAKRAQNSGQIVRAYLLYSQAAQLDPQNTTYLQRREELAPAAKLMMKVDVVNTDITADIKEAQTGKDESPVTPISHAELLRSPELAPPPHLLYANTPHSFQLRTDEKNALTQVASAYGITILFDPAFVSRAGTRLSLDGADFKTAMEAVSLATNTFLFPVAERTLFAARDTEIKRRELEPVVSLTMPLPYSIDTKDVVEAANAVRGVLSLRTIAWDSVGHVVVIRDRMERARVAQSLFAALLLPKAQVSLRVRLFNLSASTTYHYGLSIPTSFSVLQALKIGNFETAVSTSTSLASTLAFRVGSLFFGVGLTNANLFATYSNSTASSLYDATVTVADGQTATLHVGDKYPIPQAIYTGASQTNGLATLTNPIGQVNLEDLGLVLKVAARVTANEDVALDLEAESKGLGSEVINTVPSIAQRVFKGNVRLQKGEWAVIAGLNSESVSNSKTGLAGLTSIPGVNQVLSENNRSRSSSDLLIVIQPTITALPMSNAISPQLLLGPQRGARVLL